MNMRLFGSLDCGDVYELTLTNGRGMEAKILSLGAALRSLTVTDEAGRKRDVVLGYDTAEEYFFGDSYFGATVGRFANRIAGARFTLDGKEYRLPANEGANQLHGGPFGFTRQLWTAVPLNDSEAVFRLVSPDGDMGFPGTLSLEVGYQLTEDSLVIRDQAETDAPTVLNLTNHSYFNLNGHDSGSTAEHVLWLNAGAYTPTDEQLIPTGEIRSVSGTALDLREEKRLGELLSDPVFQRTNGPDHNYVLDPGPVQARLKEPDGTLTLEVITDQPGLQLYAAGGLSGEAGKDGAVYEAHQGICLETQGFPDAVHHGNFPSPVLRPGEIFRSQTVYRFSGISRRRRRKAALLWV